MVDFCRDQGLSIAPLIAERYKFKDNKFADSVFLKSIQDRLKAYAEGGEKFDYQYQSLPPSDIVYKTGDNQAVYNEEKRRKKEEIEINKKFNKDIRLLRNEYLHWNAAYGEGKHGIVDTLIQTAAQANQPNFEGGIRKRKVR